MMVAMRVGVSYIYACLISAFLARELAPSLGFLFFLKMRVKPASICHGYFDSDRHGV